MNTRVACSALALAVLFAAPSARAQSNIAVEIAPFGGVTFFLSDPPTRFALTDESRGPIMVTDGRFDHTWWTLGASMELQLGDGFGVTVDGARSPTTLVSTGGLGDNGVDVYAYGITGTFYPPDHEKLGPLVGLGIGGQTYDFFAPGIGSHTDVTGLVVGGFRYRITDRIALRLQAEESLSRFRSNVAGVSDTWISAPALTSRIAWRVKLP